MKFTDYWEFLNHFLMLTF